MPCSAHRRRRRCPLPSPSPSPPCGCTAMSARSSAGCTCTLCSRRTKQKSEQPSPLLPQCLVYFEMLSFMRSAVLRPASSLTGCLALQPAASTQSTTVAPLNLLLPFVRFATKKAAGSSKNGAIVFAFSSILRCRFSPLRHTIRTKFLRYSTNICLRSHQQPQAFGCQEIR
jgi:hypothetical protein